jgi:hypothetical protein
MKPKGDACRVGPIELLAGAARRENLGTQIGDFGIGHDSADLASKVGERDLVVLFIVRANALSGNHDVPRVEMRP